MTAVIIILILAIIFFFVTVYILTTRKTLRWSDKEEPQKDRDFFQGPDTIGRTKPSTVRRPATTPRAGTTYEGVIEESRRRNDEDYQRNLLYQQLQNDSTPTSHSSSPDPAPTHHDNHSHSHHDSGSSSGSSFGGDTYGGGHSHDHGSSGGDFGGGHDGGGHH